MIAVTMLNIIQKKYEKGKTNTENDVSLQSVLRFIDGDFQADAMVQEVALDDVRI